MTMNLFDQFLIPYFIGVPLIVVSLLPTALCLTPPMRPLTGRMTMLLMWLMHNLTKQLLQQAPNQAHPWAMPLVATMLLLSLLNLLGLLPYTFTPTTQLSFNIGLAMPMWLATILLGLRKQLSKTIAHLLPAGSPPPLIPALVVIETISNIVRPLALSVRITANLTAGHLLVSLISMTLLTLISAAKAAAIFVTILLLLLTGLELAVALIQAYVFVLLVTLYLQENM
uniref:ATP synthase subunit a n=1 Tax=Uroplatus ebenaui TaxID=357318 RepID=A0A0A1H9T2_9SAUR|nr:ATP synthase F0 subunit 6 [Uroplatus ebenaui]BAP90314.1 ATPase subunit 6 [Uroplatus ebenaui]